MKVHFGDNYPRKKRPGDLKGGVSKNEMLDHYKVT